MRRLVVALLLVLPAVLPSMAEAAYPGANGRIAFATGGAIWTVNPDGSAPQQLTSPTSPVVDLAPSWSPDGTRIAFHRISGASQDIYLVNADGTGEMLLTTGGTYPTWSPDGIELAFAGENIDSALYRINADGSNRRRESTVEGAHEYNPSHVAWSPSRPSIAFGWTYYDRVCDPYDPFECASFEDERLGIRPLGFPDPDHFVGIGAGSDPEWSPNGEEMVHVTERIRVDYYTYSGTYGDIRIIGHDGGGGRTIVAGPATDVAPAWSPDGTKIVFNRQSGGSSAVGLWVVDPDGSNPVRILATGSQPDWQPLQRPYPRPKSANPVRVSLVPAYGECTEPTRTHGPPLAHPSCNPPVPGSSRLFVGVGDGHPTPARSVGFVRVKTILGPPGGPDDTDVRLRLRLSNVMNVSDFSEYTGVLRPELTVRLTDREGFQHQTTQDFPLGFDVPCAATASTTEGALCDLATTVDAVVPGSAPEGTRAIWQLGQVKVYDGGPAGDGTDGSLFAVQGVFVP